ncbi:MAG: hypothetical protein ACOCXW_00630 [Bacteroidota bacterium]
MDRIVNHYGKELVKTKDFNKFQKLMENGVKHGMVSFKHGSRQHNFNVYRYKKGIYVGNVGRSDHNGKTLQYAIDDYKYNDDQFRYFYYIK